MKKGIELSVNNGGTLFLTQASADGDTILNRYDGDKMTYERTIPSGDMVMLLNLYRYVMDNNIQNDFINPCGDKADPAKKSVEDVLAATRAEAAHTVDNPQATMDCRKAWYYTHLGEIEMARFMELITDNRRVELSKEWKKHNPALCV